MPGLPVLLLLPSTDPFVLALPLSFKIGAFSLITGSFCKSTRFDVSMTVVLFEVLLRYESLLCAKVKKGRAKSVAVKNNLDFFIIGFV